MEEAERKRLERVDFEEGRGTPSVGGRACGSPERGPRRTLTGAMAYRVELERENDGRWLAEVTDLPGCMAYGATSEEALARAQALALRVLADRLEHGEWPAGPVAVTFEADAAA